MKLSKLLQSDKNIIVPLKSDNASDILNELLSVFKLDDKKHKKYLKALLKREEESSTGIGNEIAIPHIRSDIETDFKIAIGISEQGIKFKDPTKCKTKVFFLTISPSEKGNQHLALLSHIAVICKDNGIIEKIKSAKENKEVYTYLSEKEQSLKKLKDDMEVKPGNIKTYQLLLIILYKEEYLSDILSILFEFGLKKTNVFEGKKIESFMAANLPIFQGFRDMMHEDEKICQYISSVVEEEKVFRIAKMIENITGGFNTEEDGYVISVPVNFHLGI